MALALVLAALVVLSAPATAKKSKLVILDDEQTQAALLQIDDMPTGWSTVPPTPAELPSATGGPCGGPNEPARAENASMVRYQLTGFTADPNAGPSLAESLFVFPSNRAAKTFMAANKALLTECPAFDDTIEGDPFGVAITKVSFPKIGDDVVALRFVASGKAPAVQGTTLTQDQSYIRAGNYVIAISQSGGGPAAGSTDPALSKKYADVALDNLGSAIQAAKRAAKQGGG